MSRKLQGKHQRKVGGCFTYFPPVNDDDENMQEETKEESSKVIDADGSPGELPTLRGRYDRSLSFKAHFISTLSTYLLAPKETFLSRQEATQIQAGNCPQRNKKIPEKHRTLDTKRHFAAS